MITAEILAPSPKDSGGEFAASDNKKEQYLAAVGDSGVPDVERVQPFEKKWPASAADYPARRLRRVRQRAGRPGPEASNDGAADGGTARDMQPDVLAAAADKLDGTLNNQSLVVLFTCQGKKLLFVGDAQWGNWAYWLYGKAVTGADPGITATRQGDPRLDRLLQGRPPRQHQRDADPRRRRAERRLRRDVLHGDRRLRQSRQEDRGAAHRADGCARDQDQVTGWCAATGSPPATRGRRRGARRS